MISPNETFKWYFGEDPLDETEDGRHLLLRYGSANYWIDYEQQKPKPDDPEFWAKCVALADKLVVGASFDWKGAGESLTTLQVRCLVGSAHSASLLSEDHKKKYKSSPQSPVDGSAGSAASDA